MNKNQTTKVMNLRFVSLDPQLNSAFDDIRIKFWIFLVKATVGGGGKYFVTPGIPGVQECGYNRLGIH